MAKKKRRPQRQIAVPRQEPLSELAEAQALMAQKRWQDARFILESLARRYPRRAEVLGSLVNVCYELKDIQGYLQASRQLVQLTPDDPDLNMGLAGAYLATMHPFLALRTFRRFLERWPEHPRAGEVRETVEGLEPTVRQLLGEMGLDSDDAFDLAGLHEEAQLQMEQGESSRAEQTVGRLLRRRPDFVPGLNNLSQIYAIEGQLERAIQTAERVLTLDPDNPHALSNLTRYLLLAGRTEEAGRTATRLKTIELERPDVWAKKAEALSYVGDHQGVLDVFHAARASSEPDPTSMPLLYHLAAVATMRLGRVDEARGYWKEAARSRPGLDLARENLADLRRPVGERHAPWPFNIGNWVSSKTIEDLTVQLTPRSGGDQSVARGMERFVRRHPELAVLVPVLLDRGDPAGREFALRMALESRTPEMLAALRDFALSDRGPDDMRNQAAQAVSEEGLLPSGPTRLWIQGEWREVILLGFEIHGEPSPPPQSEVQPLLAEAHEALRAKDGARGARLIEQALEIVPDDPRILHNLSVAYELQRRSQEAEAILEQIHARHPDYLFARAGLARKHMERGEIEEAKALLDPLLSRKRLHVSEFSALCAAYIELGVAEGKPEAARSWLDILAQVNPDFPSLDVLRSIVRSMGRKRLLSLRS